MALSTGSTPTTAPSIGDAVRVQLPASEGYLHLLRLSAAALAARLEFTVEAIDDLRLAVTETAAMLLPCSVSGAHLNTEFTVGPREMAVRMDTLAVDGAELPDREEFAWLLLTTLTDHAEASLEEGTMRVELRVRPAPARDSAHQGAPHA
ncbi:MAG: anti-sigma regulatory factor [Streptomycetales bacterium]